MKNLFFILSLLPIAVIGAETIKLAIIDTNVCIKDYYNKYFPKAAIKEIINPTTDSKEEHKCYPQMNFRRELHGHFVLSEVLERTKNHQLEISIFVVFDKHGHQSIKYWPKILELINTGDFHLVLSAVGLYLDIGDTSYKNIKITNKIPFLLAKGIEKTNFTLFPQNIKQTNISIVDQYIPYFYKSDNYRYGYIPKENKNYIYESGGAAKDQLRGSSRAVALAAAKAINHCSSLLLNRTTNKKLTKCLKSDAI